MKEKKHMENTPAVCRWREYSPYHVQKPGKQDVSFRMERRMAASGIVSDQ